VPDEGGIRFGQYVLQRRIARGGMAEVFLAQQRGIEGGGRRVAVKRILPHLASASDFIQMFLDEARLASQLSHPNIVHIHDFGKVDADHFIAMEYVDGVDTGQVFRRGGADRLPPAMVARIGADAAAALHYAHELRAPDGQPYGLVHRDVSPANLMVSFDGVAKLCDFGIAKAVALGDRRLTSAGVVKGKYAYMSPEQTAGTPLDGRSDVYSLAIVLWELLAGTTLVPRGDAVAGMRAIRVGRLTPIEQAAPDTPAPLAEAIRWALATRREDRATAAQLAQALEAFLQSCPELATPMQLGEWLRARFPREAAGEATGEAVTDDADDEDAAETTIEAAAAPGDEPTRLAPDTMRDRVLALFESTPPPPAPSAPASTAHPRPNAVPAPSAMRRSVLAMFEPTRPGASAASRTALEDRETLLRSGAFRVPVPSGPASVPTLIEPRTAARPPTAPAHGRSRPATVTNPAIVMPPRTRIAVMALGMGGLGLLSFAIVLAVRDTPRTAVEHGTTFAARDTSTLKLVPADAAPDAVELVDAPVPAPVDAPAALPADAPTARLEVHTDPAGATVAIHRCPDPAQDGCGRPPGAARLDDCAAAHCSFALPAGSYEIIVERNGARETRRVALTGEETTSLDIVVSAAARSGRAATGRLTVHTRQRCSAVLDDRRRLQTPIFELELRPGPHQLELSCGQRPETRSVAIAAGKTTELTIAPR